jgi:hypothetical protein
MIESSESIREHQQRYEISIPLVSQKYPDKEIPKRPTVYKGRPIMENMYFSEDEDLMLQAIREVVGAASRFTR